jgi:hypothetical protein
LEQLSKVKKLPSSKKLITKNPQNSHILKASKQELKLELLQNLVHLLLRKQNLFTFLNVDLEY